jgi:voltage-gated potassium channel
MTNIKNLCKKIACSKYFDKYSALVILLSIVAFAISTEIRNPKWHDIFYNISLCFGVLFLLEYLIRIFAVQTISKAVFKPLMIIDFIVIVSIFYPVDYNFIILRAISLLKFVRILHMGKYQIALQAIKKAFILEKEPLIITMIFFITIIIISSGLIYVIEKNYGEFYSWPRCIYWAIITGSGVGYGDMVPITAIGRTIASLTALFGLLSYSMITVIFASGFIEIIRQEKKKKQKKEED